jgi:hypothetical protein
MSRTTVPAVFTEERDHFLYVRCKDDGGGVTLATMQFHVVQIEPTKNLCYIDDWRKYPKDLAHGEPMDDDVWQAMLEGYNYGEDWEDVTWDEWEVPFSEHTPSLEFLSQFRVLVWSLNDDRSNAFNQQSAWFYMNDIDHMNVLALYMTRDIVDGERGKVWAFGKGLVQSSLLADLGYFCEYPYIVDDDMSCDPDCGIRRHSFATEFLHITGEFDTSDETSGGTRIAFYSSYWSDRPSHVFVDTAGPAIPEDKYTRPPAAELYPNLPRKLAANPDWVSRSLRFFEVLDYPRPDQEKQYLFYDPVAGEMTGLIPLYRVHASYTTSDAHNKYCGFRYIPTKPTDPGEIVYFFFPMFSFNDNHIRATAKVILSDWFGLPDPDLNGGGADETGSEEARVQP